eukprot:scaffold4174_cov122-Isochrysis_galbana.AAC.16
MMRTTYVGIYVGYLDLRRRRRAYEPITYGTPRPHRLGGPCLSQALCASSGLGDLRRALGGWDWHVPDYCCWGCVRHERWLPGKAWRHRATIGGRAAVRRPCGRELA